MSKIIHNMVRCRKCMTVIESRSRHDYITCPCGNVSVDGGREYLKRVFKKKEDYEELSI